MVSRENKRSESEARRLREKRIYNQLTGRGKRDYFLWDRGVMSDLYAERKSFHDKLLFTYVRGKRVLILGCGRGAGVGKLSPYTKKITGIDISKRQINLAKQLYPEFVFTIGDAENLPFRDNSFNIIYCKAILHHLDLSEALKEIRRVLVPEGCLYVDDEPGLLNPIAWIRRVFFPSVIHSPDEQPFLPFAFRKLLYRNGFHEIAFKHFFIFSPIIPVLAKIFPRINWLPILHFLIKFDRLLTRTPLREMCWRISGLYSLQ